MHVFDVAAVAELAWRRGGEARRLSVVDRTSISRSKRQAHARRQAHEVHPPRCQTSRWPASGQRRAWGGKRTLAIDTGRVRLGVVEGTRVGVKDDDDAEPG